MSAKKRWAALYEDLEQILDGLVHAFNNGILHRDLKPANVMVEITESKEDPKQVFKLIDFGLATKDEAFSENQLTLKGIGTHLYTPESTKEREESLETIDVYSWAVMAIEYLAIPYIKNGIQEFSNYPDLLRVFEDDIEPNYPKAVTKLLKRCVSLRPKNCPKNIIELKREIEDINKKLRSA